eukprot:1145360-Pelagomonas_calceolata.AAC.2
MIFLSSPDAFCTFQKEESKLNDTQVQVTLAVKSLPHGRQEFAFQTCSLRVAEGGRVLRGGRLSSRDVAARAIWLLRAVHWQGPCCNEDHHTHAIAWSHHPTMLPDQPTYFLLYPVWLARDQQAAQSHNPGCRPNPM